LIDLLGKLKPIEKLLTTEKINTAIGTGQFNCHPGNGGRINFPGFFSLKLTLHEFQQS